MTAYIFITRPDTPQYVMLQSRTITCVILQLGFFPDLAGSACSTSYDLQAAEIFAFCIASVSLSTPWQSQRACRPFSNLALLNLSLPGRRLLWVQCKTRHRFACSDDNQHALSIPSNGIMTLWQQWLWRHDFPYEFHRIAAARTCMRRLHPDTSLGSILAEYFSTCLTAGP